MFNESEEGNKITPRVVTDCGEQQEQTRIIPTAALPHFLLLGVTLFHLTLLSGKFCWPLLPPPVLP